MNEKTFKKFGNPEKTRLAMIVQLLCKFVNTYSPYVGPGLCTILIRAGIPHPQNGTSFAMAVSIDNYDLYIFKDNFVHCLLFQKAHR
jgi:hypothetical protein